MKNKILSLAVVLALVITCFSGIIHNEFSVKKEELSSKEKMSEILSDDALSSVFLEDSDLGIELKIYDDGAINEWASPSGKRLTYEGFSSESTCSVGIKIDDTFYLCYDWGQYITDPLTKIDSTHAQIGLTFPENVKLTIFYEIVVNASMFTFHIENEDNQPHDVGIKWYYDTMVADNDGAPIYIPGQGIQEYERTFYNPTFDYFSGYDDPINPSLVSTGWIGPNKGATLPDVVQLLDWSHGRNSWSVQTNSNTDITGDSAVNLLWNETSISPSNSRTITTFYGVGEPIAHGTYSIVDAYTDRPDAKYLPGDDSVIGVDVYSHDSDLNGGDLRLVIYNGVTEYKNESKEIDVSADTIYTESFDFTIPSYLSLGTYLDAKFYLYDENDDVVDVKTEKNFLNIAGDYEFSITTDKPSYCIGETIRAYATLTLNGEPCTNAEVIGFIQKQGGSHTYSYYLKDNGELRIFGDLFSNDGVYSTKITIPDTQSGSATYSVRATAEVDGNTITTETTCERSGWPHDRLNVYISEILDTTEPQDALYVGDTISITAEVKDSSDNPYGLADVSALIKLPNHTTDKIQFTYTGSSGIYTGDYIVPLKGTYIIEVSAESQGSNYYTTGYDTRFISVYKGELNITLISPEENNVYNKNEYIPVEIEVKCNNLIVNDVHPRLTIQGGSNPEYIDLRYIGDGRYEGFFIPTEDGDYSVSCTIYGVYYKTTTLYEEDYFSVYPEPVELKQTITSCANLNKGYLDTMENLYDVYSDDTDYFYEKLSEDKVAVVCDVFFALLSIGIETGQFFDKIPKFSDIIDKHLPGLPLVGKFQPHDTRLYKTANTRIYKAISQGVNGDFSRFSIIKNVNGPWIKGINDGLRDAYIRHLVKEHGIETGLKGTEIIVEKYLPQILSQNGGISDTLDPTFSQVISDYKQGIEEDEQYVNANLQGLDPTIEDELINDIKLRTGANLIKEQIFYYSGDLLTFSHTQRVREDNNLFLKIINFICWFALPILLNILLDGPAWVATAIAVGCTLAHLACNLKEDFENLDDDQKNLAIGYDLLLQLGPMLSTEMYLNTVGGMYQPFDPDFDGYPTGEILSTKQVSVGEWGWIPGDWVEKQRYGEVEIKNTGDQESLFQLGASVLTKDNYFMWYEMDTTKEEPFGVHLAPQQSKTLKITLNDHSNDIKKIKYYLLAMDPNGTYEADTTSFIDYTYEKDENNNLGGLGSLSNDPPLFNEVESYEPTLSYPIETSYSSSSDTLENNVTIKLENSMEYALAADIIQTIPENIDVTNPQLGEINESNIEWQVILQPHGTTILNFSVIPIGDPGENITLSGAYMEFYDQTINDTVNFTSNDIVMYVENPYYVDVLVNEYYAGDLNNELSMNITNIGNESIDLSIALNLTNVSDQNMSYLENDTIIVPAESTVGFDFIFNPNLNEGLYLLKLTSIYNDTEEIFYSSFVTIDSDNPKSTCSLSGNSAGPNKYTGVVTMNVGAVDSSSGIDKIYYRINSGLWVESDDNISDTVTGVGVYEIDFYSIDILGHSEDIDSVSFEIEEEQDDPDDPPVDPPVEDDDQKPYADAGGPYEGYAYTEINFDGSDSVDDNKISKYEWDFGDGNTGAGKKPTHIYTDAGEYTVTLTVTDNNSQTDEDTATALIAPRANVPPTNLFVTAPDFAKVDKMILFKADAYDPDEGDQIRYIFNWSDGSNLSYTEYNDSNISVEANHTYDEPGEYEIKVYAEDKANARSENETLNINIYNDYEKVTNYILDVDFYLIDTGYDGIFDIFLNNTNEQNSDISYCSENKSYSIDDDEDGEIDYVYYTENSSLVRYQAEPEKNKEEDADELLLIPIIAIILILIIIIILIVFLLKRKKDKKTMNETRPIILDDKKQKETKKEPVKKEAKVSVVGGTAFCTNCGEELKPDATFCTQCGNKIE